MGGFILISEKIVKIQFVQCIFYIFKKKLSDRNSVTKNRMYTGLTYTHYYTQNR